MAERVYLPDLRKENPTLEQQIDELLYYLGPRNFYGGHINLRGVDNNPVEPKGYPLIWNRKDQQMRLYDRTDWLDFAVLNKSQDVTAPWTFSSQVTFNTETIFRLPVLFNTETRFNSTATFLSDIIAGGLVNVNGDIRLNSTIVWNIDTSTSTEGNVIFFGSNNRLTRSPGFRISENSHLILKAINIMDSIGLHMISSQENYNNYVSMAPFGQGGLPDGSMVFRTTNRPFVFSNSGSPILTIQKNGSIAMVPYQIEIMDEKLLIIGNIAGSPYRNIILRDWLGPERFIIDGDYALELKNEQAIRNYYFASSYAYIRFLTPNRLMQVDASNHIVTANNLGNFILGTPGQITVTDNGDGTVTLSGGSQSNQFDDVIITTGGDIKPTSNSTTAINFAQADGTDFITLDTKNKKLRFGTTTPGAQLDIKQNSADENYGHAVPQRGGTPWFNAEDSYFGVEDTPEYLLPKNTDFSGGSVTYRKPSSSTTGKWWLLFVENTGVNTWTVRFGAQFTLPAGTEGEQVTQVIASANTTIGSPITHPTNDYYIAWKSGVVGALPGGKFYVDNDFGGAIDYVLDGTEPTVGGTYTTTAQNTAYRMHITVSKGTAPHANIFRVSDINGEPILSTYSNKYTGFGTTNPEAPIHVKLTHDTLPAEYIRLHSSGSGINTELFQTYYMNTFQVAKFSTKLLDAQRVGFIFSVTNDGGMSVPNVLIMRTQDLYPVTNKGYDLGLTTQRFNNIYYVNGIIGTSRLAKAKTICDTHTCPSYGKPMKQGTGANVILGETEDYIKVFCPDCGSQKTEALNHMPKKALANKRQAPKIVFEGIKVRQYSGHSRGIQVMFRYGDDTEAEQAPRNSTYLSDSEYAKFLAMNQTEQKQFLLSLGQREWEAMEEARIMEEECKKEQEMLDNISEQLIGLDLLAN